MSRPSQTPRTTRSRAQTPLPALQTRQSHAYGAAGKASLSQQVTTSATDFANAFTNTRTRGSTRVPSEAPSNAPARESSPVKKSRKSKHVTEDPVQEDLDDQYQGDDSGTVAPQPPQENGRPSGEVNREPSFDEVRPETSLTSNASYSSPRGAPPTMPPPPPPGPRPAAVPMEENFRPNSFSVFIRTLPRYIRRLLGDANSGAKGTLLTVLLTLAVIAAFFHMPLPDTLYSWRQGASYRAAWLLGVPGYEYSPTEIELRWRMFTQSFMFSDDLPNPNGPGVQFALNERFHKRLNDHDNVTVDLQHHVAIQQASLEELQRILPQTIVASDVNGEWTVPPLFWKALVQKMTAPDDSAPLWKHFLESNEQKLQTWNHDFYERHIDDIASRHHLINKDEFEAAVIDSKRIFQGQIDESLRVFRTEVLKEARTAMKDELERSEVMALARMQLSALAHSNMIYNTDKALREINYFAPGLGAVVDPYATSAVYFRPMTWAQSLWSMTGWRTKYVNAAATALYSWEEATECWCAAPSSDEKAKAQLTVMTAYKIYPTEFTIEHIPAKGTRDIASAPRDFEVWAQVANASEATRINESIGQSTPFHTVEIDEPCQGPPPNGEKNWVCLAAESYDIHFHNFVQSWIIWPQTIDLDIATSKIAVRVLTNWGEDDHTCLYRVRLTGKEVDAPRD